MISDVDNHKPKSSKLNKDISQDSFVRNESLRSKKIQKSGMTSMSISTIPNKNIIINQEVEYRSQISSNKSRDQESIDSASLSPSSQNAKKNKIMDILKQQMEVKTKKKLDDQSTGRTFAENLDEEQIILPNINNKYENTKEVETDFEEDTKFGQAIMLKDGSISTSNDEPLNNWKPNMIIANIIHIFLIISGIYCCFLGFRFFKLTMILLGLDFSYYFVVLFLTEFDIYDGQNIGHQLGVFFGSICLGFIVSIISYLYEKSQFFIIGVSISSMISVFIAQFFIDFDDTTDKLIILSIYLGCAVIFTIAAYASQHSTLIWGTVIVGSILATINFGVLLNDFKSFEQREKLPADRYSDFVNYLIANAILICLGLLVQFYLKKKIIQRLRKEDEEMDSDMYTIRATTFL